jgi:hypothetical protein
MGFYVARRDLYASKTASDVTSETYWIGDARSISLWLEGSATTSEVQVSNDDGRIAVIAENTWSTLSTVIGTGSDMLDIEPGPRWLRVLRSGTSSAVLNLQQLVT